MSSSILVGYATRYGSTAEAAEVVATVLRENNLESDLQTLSDVKSLDGYSAVVIGAPLFMYRWHKDALRFLTRFEKVLITFPVAVFALGPVQQPLNQGEWQDSAEQLDKELAKFQWFKPATKTIFGGRFDPQKLGFPFKMFAGKEPASDILDRDVIRAWAMTLPTIFA